MRDEWRCGGGRSDDQQVDSLIAPSSCQDLGCRSYPAMPTSKGKVSLVIEDYWCCYALVYDMSCVLKILHEIRQRWSTSSKCHRTCGLARHNSMDCQDTFCVVSSILPCVPRAQLQCYTSRCQPCCDLRHSIGKAVRLKTST